MPQRAITPVGTGCRDYRQRCTYRVKGCSGAAGAVTSLAEVVASAVLVGSVQIDLAASACAALRQGAPGVGELVGRDRGDEKSVSFGTALTAGRRRESSTAPQALPSRFRRRCTPSRQQPGASEAGRLPRRSGTQRPCRCVSGDAAPAGRSDWPLLFLPSPWWRVHPPGGSQPGVVVVELRAVMRHAGL